MPRSEMHDPIAETALATPPQAPWEHWGRNLSPVALVASMVAAIAVVHVLWALVVAGFPMLALSPGSRTMQVSGVVGRLLVGSLVGPPLETLLFQTAPLWLCANVLRVRAPVALFASAGLFAAAHNYGIGNIVFTFPMGVVFAMGYWVKRGTPDRPFWLVTIAHAVANGILTLMAAA